MNFNDIFGAFCTLAATPDVREINKNPDAGLIRTRRFIKYRLMAILAVRKMCDGPISKNVSQDALSLCVCQISC